MPYGVSIELFAAWGCINSRFLERVFRTTVLVQTSPCPEPPDQAKRE